MSDLSDTDPGLILRPEARGWAGLLRAHWRPQDRQRRDWRGALGLPVDAPIVMTGHQPMFWHAGILAKYMAADALARAAGARAAWIAVDQDAEDPFAIRYPTRDASGRLGSATTGRPEAGAAPGAPEVPVAHRAPGGIEAAAPGAIASVQEGLERIGRALEAHRGEASAAAQVVLALGDLLAPLMAPAPTVFATALAGSALFGLLVDRMKRDPGACIAAYNSAVARHPEAGLRQMAAERAELPLWRLERGKGRRRVFAADLAGVPAGELAPKALLLTAILRAGACDLFVHGLGGELYDRATEEWFGAWAPDLTLAPGVVATATLRLPLTDGPPLSEAQVARARWVAHRARHDPTLLADEPAGRRKGELVAAIAGSPRHSTERRTLYRTMHEELSRAREEHGATLESLRRQAAEAGARGADARIAGDRSWAFPLFTAADLRGLRARIDAAFAG